MCTTCRFRGKIGLKSKTPKINKTSILVATTSQNSEKLTRKKSPSLVLMNHLTRQSNLCLATHLLCGPTSLKLSMNIHSTHLLFQDKLTRWLNQKSCTWPVDHTLKKVYPPKAYSKAKAAYFPQRLSSTLLWSLTLLKQQFPSTSAVALKTQIST